MQPQTQLRLLKTGLVLTALALTASCGGGSSSSGTTEVVGLAGPSEVTVVTANDSGPDATPGAAPGATVAPGSTSNFQASDDYFTDTTDEFVYDASLESLDTINEILGMSAQTAYTQRVNDGAYIAQIDESLLGGSDSGEGNGQSSVDVPEFEFWTVTSTRESNSGAQTVYFWVPMEDPFGAGGSDFGTIFAEMTITESATELNPFGQFTIDFAGVQDGGSISSPVFFGELATVDALSGFIGFTFYETFGDINAVPGVGEFASERAAHVNMSSDQTIGVARISNSERFNFGMGDSGIQNEEITVAFDETHMLSQQGANPSQCFSRTEFDEQVYRYNLYYATGENAGSRVELQGGFNFTTSDDVFGWAGYYGVWVPEGTTLNDGDTVERFDWETEETTPYTVVDAPGRLIRNTRSLLALSEAVGETFEWWDFGGSPGYFQIQWDGVEWVRTAQFNDMNGTWDAISPPTIINLSAGDYLGMWSPTLGGSVNYVQGEDALTFFSEEFVDGEDSEFLNNEIILYGFTEMLASTIDQTSAENGSIYLADETDVSNPYTFVFTGDDLTLRQHVGGSTFTVVGLAESVEVTSGPFTWGMRSGPMVTDLTGVINPWDLWNVEEFYVYETGHNPWNRFTTLKDIDDEFATFDAPIQFPYTHATANDRNDDATYDGKTYMLGYGGAGDLFGIPFVGVDFTGDSEDDQYLPQFSLADGTVLGPTGTEYVVKAIDVQLNLADATGECGALNLGGAAILTLPDGTGYDEPTNGAEPTVTDPPTVVAGEVVVQD
ncbi:MAG: hypothetical protein AAFZ65_10460 [Planctomycetota bacterium]